MRNLILLSALLILIKISYAQETSLFTKAGIIAGEGIITYNGSNNLDPNSSSQSTLFGFGINTKYENNLRFKSEIFFYRNEFNIDIEFIDGWHDNHWRGVYSSNSISFDFLIGYTLSEYIYVNIGPIINSRKNISLPDENYYTIFQNGLPEFGIMAEYGMEFQLLSNIKLAMEIDYLYNFKHKIVGKDLFGINELGPDFQSHNFIFTIGIHQIINKN